MSKNKNFNLIALSFASATIGAIFSIIIYTATQNEKNSINKLTTATNPKSKEVLICEDFTMLREQNLSLVKPLLLLNNNCESKELNPVKERLNLLVDSMKSSGQLTEAGVYFRELNTLQWTGIHYDKEFFPGSLLKVPLMINILKAAETNPQLLDKKLLFDKKINTIVTESPEIPLVPGASYSVKELIMSMITDSNNDATSLLFSINNKEKYDDLFSELGLNIQPPEDLFYTMSPSDYSRFFRILYNASFLIHENSQFAMEILLKSKFKKGLTKYLPSYAKVAHKFGERYTSSDLTQFHEAGIIYSGDNPYLIVIMTEGKNHEQLMECVAQISKLLFDLHSRGFTSAKSLNETHRS